MVTFIISLIYSPPLIWIYHKRSDYILPNNENNSSTTRSGSSLCMKCPQPLAKIGPLLRSGSVIFARPALYLCQMGFVYCIDREVGVSMI